MHAFARARFVGENLTFFAQRFCARSRALSRGRGILRRSRDESQQQTRGCRGGPEHLSSSIRLRKVCLRFLPDSAQRGALTRTRERLTRRSTCNRFALADRDAPLWPRPIYSRTRHGTAGGLRCRSVSRTSGGRWPVTVEPGAPSLADRNGQWRLRPTGLGSSVAAARPRKCQSDRGRARRFDLQAGPTTQAAGRRQRRDRRRETAPHSRLGVTHAVPRYF